MASPGREEIASKPASKQKIVAPLLRFLEATGIGVREDVRERELEWKRRNNQAGVDLLE